MQIITLTKHPERAAGMGLSMSIGSSTPPTPAKPKLHVWTEASGETTYEFADNNIPEWFCSGRTDILKIVVDSGMTMGQGAFKDCTALSAATLNGKLTLKAHTFKGCTSLSEVSIGENYSRLEGWVFSGDTSLTSITIPDKVDLIGGYCFQNCTSLGSVVLGSGLTQINLQCFANCISLLEITCTAPTAPTLGANVFQNVASDGTLAVPSGSDYSTWLAALPQNWTVERISTLPPSPEGEWTDPHPHADPIGG